MKKSFIFSLGLLVSVCVFECAPGAATVAEATKKGPWVIEPDSTLPNVLILGDSISIGYTLKVREHLAGQANVFRPCSADGMKPENCEGTTIGLQEIDRWLAGRRWDVIHFNWGLHDLKHVKVAGTAQNSSSFEAPRQADPGVWEKNLKELVGKLKATRAKLIFATTTPYPPGKAPSSRNFRREHPTPFPLPIRVNLVRAPMHLDCGRAKLILRASYGRFFTLKSNT